MPHAATRFALHPQLADDTAPVIELPLCEVRLMDDANHPWLVLVPRVAGMVEIIDLDAAQRTQLAADIDVASRALKASSRSRSAGVLARKRAPASRRPMAMPRSGAPSRSYNTV